MVHRSVPVSSRWAEQQKVPRAKHVECCGGGEAVPQRVHGDVLADAGGLTGDLAGELDAADADVLGRVAAREQPLRAGALGLPVGPQQVEQFRRKHD